MFLHPFEIKTHFGVDHKRLDLDSDVINGTLADECKKTISKTVSSLIKKVFIPFLKVQYNA